MTNATNNTLNLPETQYFGTVQLIRQNKTQNGFVSFDLKRGGKLVCVAPNFDAHIGQFLNITYHQQNQAAWSGDYDQDVSPARLTVSPAITAEITKKEMPFILAKKQDELSAYELSILAAAAK
jgi:hypothetical protein